MSSEDNRSSNAHAVEELHSLGPQQVQRLRERWIGTVESLLSVTATPDGKSGLAQLLGLSLGQLEEVAKEATGIVGPDAAKRLTSPQRGGPTGAILTDEQKGNIGRT